MQREAGALGEPGEDDALRWCTRRNLPTYQPFDLLPRLLEAVNIFGAKLVEAQNVKPRGQRLAGRCDGDDLWVCVREYVADLPRELRNLPINLRDQPSPPMARVAQAVEEEDGRVGCAAGEWLDDERADDEEREVDGRLADVLAPTWEGRGPST